MRREDIAFRCENVPTVPGCSNGVRGAPYGQQDLGHRRLLHQELDGSEPDELIGDSAHLTRQVARQEDGAYSRRRASAPLHTQAPLGARRAPCFRPPPPRWLVWCTYAWMA